MTRVFIPIPTNSDINTSKTMKYGKRTFILENHRPSPMNMQETILLLREQLILHEWQPSVDYLVLSGPQLASAALLSVASDMCDEFRVLMFDAKSHEYVEKVLSYAR